MKNAFCLFLAGIFLLSIQACTDKVDQALYHYSADEYEILKQKLNLPEGTFDYSIVTNIPIPYDKDLPFHKATLGRVLFYDKMLSVDESTSCASCHKQELAFADDVRFSEGLEGQIGTRNSLPLGNTIGFVRYYGTDLNVPSGSFSWDESKPSINDQSRAAITSKIEMGHNMWDLVENINKQDYYQVLFKKVYGNEGATESNILDAVTEFVNSFSSRESAFDKAVGSSNPYQNLVAFNSSENNGRELFNTHCTTCHDANHNAIVLTAANNGLDLTTTDVGMGGFTNKESHMGLFKVPSLRNIELTGPYMHDGRFATLEDVIEHYSNGIQNHPNLHNSLKANSFQAKKFDFTATEKTDLISYLKTLTDQEFVTAEKYSDPFK